MLNTNPDEILFDEAGKVQGIRVGENTATAPIVICDPTYTTEDKLIAKSRVIRVICLLDHPIPGTNDAQSIQIILPANQLNRNNDTYISMVSYSHLICAKGIYVVSVSTTIETENPMEEI